MPALGKFKKKKKKMPASPKWEKLCLLEIDNFLLKEITNQIKL